MFLFLILIIIGFIYFVNNREFNNKQRDANDNKKYI